MESFNKPELPDLKAERRFVSRVGIAVFIFCLLYFLVQNLSADLMYGYAPEITENSYLYYAVLMLPAYAVAIAGCMLFGKNIPTTPIAKNKLRFSGFCAYFLVAMAMLYAGNLVGNTIGSLIDSFVGGDSYAVDDLIEETSTGATLLFVVLIGPAVEELIFRKFLCDRLARYGEAAAVIMPGLLFGLFHGNFYQFFYAALLGMLFAYVYLKTGKIWISFCLHALINLIGGIVGSFVSGLIGEDLLDMLDALEGGEFTAEMIDTLMRNLPQLAVFCIYDFLTLSAVAGGVVLLIVKRRKIRFNPGSVNLGENRFSVMWVNPGIVLFCVLSAVIFATQIALF